VERSFASETPGSWNNLVAAREVGDSLFIISDLPGFRYRVLRTLYSSQVGNLGFRFAPTQALCYGRAPRAAIKGFRQAA
jgi:hypothetical protein